MEGFRALSQRGIIVNVKCFPLKPNEIKEWERRLLDLVDLSESPKNDEEWFIHFLERYTRLSPDYCTSLARKYNCQYLIAYQEQPNLYQFVKKGWPLVYENPIYAVFAVPYN